MRGRDLKSHGVRETLILPDSKIVEMIFSFETLAIAEEVYLEAFNRDLDIIAITEELSGCKRDALHSIAFGAVQTADKSVSFENYLKTIGTEEYFPLLYAIVVAKLNEMLYQGPDTGGEIARSFPWDSYYKCALGLGLSDAEFWAATPKKLRLLIRDVETEERQSWLTRNFV